MDTKNLIKHICSSLDTRKAEDILVLDIQSVSSIADFFIIASADSERAVKSLAENLVREVKKKFKLKAKIDGLTDNRWIIIDTGDLIVHIFHSETRVKYDLESLWYEAKKVSGILILLFRFSNKSRDFKVLIVSQWMQFINFVGHRVFIIIICQT